jgi:hypothetical protein
MYSFYLILPGYSALMESYVRGCQLAPLKQAFHPWNNELPESEHSGALGILDRETIT